MAPSAPPPHHQHPYSYPGGPPRSGSHHHDVDGLRSTVLAHGGATGGGGTILGSGLGADGRDGTPAREETQYKRASRRGAVRRFKCDYPDCSKVYSRAEHLQRHQLNHNPREIYQCDVESCDQRFVRADLLARHKKRHSVSYTPRNRIPSFSTPEAASQLPAPMQYQPLPPVPFPPHASQQTPLKLPQQQLHHAPIPLSQPSPKILPPPPIPSSTSSPTSSLGALPTSQPGPPSHMQQQQQQKQQRARGPYELLTPESNPTPTPVAAASLSPMTHTGNSTWPHPMEQHPNPGRLVNSKQPPPAYSYYEELRDHPRPNIDAPAMIPFSSASVDPEVHTAHGSFAVWLFDPQASYSDYKIADLSFQEGGLESTFNSNLQYEYESFSNHSQSAEPLVPPAQQVMIDGTITAARRQEIVQLFQVFRVKKPKYEPLLARLGQESGGDLPALSLDMLQACVDEYWSALSPRLPVIHQPTFSVNSCSVLLLMVIAALGAASLRNKATTVNAADYEVFSDLIIECARWEIVMADESSPPVSLWMAQALLLLEYYEKLYSTRRFHERAHIYHTAMLTLLRRGSPLIGRAGSESPPEEPSAAESGRHGAAALDSRKWWFRWAETESMHRVVFVAFMLDIVHAAMFGHSADMAPHEIRLPLPCDDNLWTATSPDHCRDLDANLRMYGIRQVSFLDGLKNAIHGKEVGTHSFARMIIMSGLLSVGWHLNHRENHLRWLNPRASASEQSKGNWRKVLLKAFDNWKASFDRANGESEGGSRLASNGPIHSAAVLYHLAHISLHVDIIDCQVYAGATRLLGRRVSSRDQTNAAHRMGVWATHPSTRHAVLHAFQLLNRVLVDPRTKMPPGYVPDSVSLHYSLANEVDPHRPWIMYYAALSIWSFDRALGSNAGRIPLQVRQGSTGNYRKLVGYLMRVSEQGELSEKAATSLQDGLPDLLDVLQGILGGARSELLREAHVRLGVCKELLSSSSVLG